MAETVREVMAARVSTVDEDVSLVEAARIMRDEAIGDVVIVRDGRPVGILTDRDIVTRAIAEAKDAGETTVAETCTREIVAVAPDDPLKQAAALVREHAVRRIPVVEDGKLVGILSLGDLAIEREEQSPLADISAARPSA